MRPPVRSSPSSARSPNHEISSGSAKCCKESTAAAKDKNAGPFSEIQHTTPANIRGNQMANNGVLSSRSVVKTTRERERAFQHVIDRPSKKANKRKSTLKFWVLPFRFLFWAFVCVVFWKEKAKCILFNIYSDFLCWLAAAAALSGNMDNSNQTPT
jgi:hypothetical protein